MFSSRVTATLGPLSCLNVFELSIFCIICYHLFYLYSIGSMSDRQKVNSSWIPTAQVDSFDAEDEMENRSSSDSWGPAALQCARSGAKLFQLHNSWYLIALRLRDSGNAEGWKRLSFCSERLMQDWGLLQCTVQGMYAVLCMQHCSTALQMMR